MVVRRYWGTAVILYKRYERPAFVVSMVAGFLVDFFTLSRVDLWLDNLVLLFYLMLAMTSIVLFNLREAGKLKKRWLNLVGTFAPLPMQYAFGGLFSGFLIFYWQSASIAASWPFLLFLACMLVGNEFFRERYERLVFQISILFLAVFSYFVFSVPVLIKSMGPGVFIVSGVVSVLVTTTFLYLLSLWMPERIRVSKSALSRSIIGIFAVMNILYFANVIPPIPLSLKEIGIYNMVSRQGGEYIRERIGEIPPWYKRLFSYEKLIVEEGDPAYVYTAVFAPTSLGADIIHHWQYFDAQKNVWTTVSRVEYQIVGGRDGGYRGYSFYTNMQEGLWRVRVETERGQMLGNAKFRVERPG